MSIQIKITAENANEVVQLIQDLANVLPNMDPDQIPPKTEVSTIDNPVMQEQPTQAPQSVPVAEPAPVAQQPEQPAVQSAVPTAEKTYSMDELAVAATQLMDAGKQQELLQLLNSFGVQALTMLPQEHYGAFATKLRELGAKI